MLKARVNEIRRKLTATALGLLAVTGAFAEPRKVEAVPWCVINSDGLWINTIIESVETPIKGADAQNTPNTYRYYWAIHCYMATGDCVASGLNLDNLEKGEPIGFGELVQPDGMRLVSVAGKVATIVWGINTFTLDVSKQLVSYRNSGQTTDTVGSGPCAP
ncbi:hypothetical protein E8E95_05855 [Pseudomonas sp. BN414]|uniref:hypothetical protein n=1 Tax=Pseudomonas sp. BN414 TaxID=2567888 RepID=UPI00245796C2|nr:hypothetical protein [Pseudomonas sp. BN414]MDH4566198.1 hypothetical protein [Pseudomonas sp. BN414]